MTEWRKQTLSLKPDHAWKARPGNRIFVADKGAVRFEFPEEWVVVPTSDSIHVYDRQPPDDDCRLAVSYLRLPDIDWSGLPLSQLLKAAATDDPRKPWPIGSTMHHPREDIEVAWDEYGFLDPIGHREACTRFGLARGFRIQALLTFDFWPEDRERVHPVWEMALDTLVLGKTIQDPTKGELYS